MITPSVFSDKHLIAVMKKIHIAMDATCCNVGDISFGEYALLTSVAEYDSGLLLNWVCDKKGPSDSLNCVRTLEDKELICRVRDATDRRNFALKATSKGRIRLALTDEANAAALISENERWTEEEFEYFINKAHALPSVYTAQGRITTIFPGAFLTFVHNHRQIMVETAAYYGMTTLQASILYALRDVDTPLPLSYFTRVTEVPSVVIEFQVSDLAKRDLIRTGQLVELTEKGILRVEDLARKASLQIDTLFADFLEEDAVSFEELGEYCMYLFS